MKKRILSIGLIVVLVFALTACGGSGSTTDKPADEPAQEETTAAGDDPKEETSDEVFTLKLSYYASETIPPGQAVLEAIKTAEEKSNGRLKFDAYFSGTLVSKEDTMASLKTGMIDMSPCDAAQIAQVSVLNQVFNAMIQTELPADRQKIQDVYVKMLEEIPELNEEMIKNSNVQWVYPFAMGGHNLHGMTRTATVDDIKGQKVEAKGLEGQYVNLLGGTAVELDSGDYYNGMKLGTVDSQFTHWAVMNNYQVNEVVKYHTIFGKDPLSAGIMAPAMGYFINADTWAKLPADLQQILTESFIVGANYVINADNERFC